MKSKKFYKEIEVLLFLIKRYGLSKCSFRLEPKSMSKEQMDFFISSVHEGFMKAQKIVVANLIFLAEEKRKTKEKLKAARVAKAPKEIQTEIEYKLIIIEFQDTTFRKIADSILWQLVGYDNTVINRLYQGKPKIDISNANIDFDLDIAIGIFESDKKVFPLLCDITNVAQVGDLFIKDYSKGRNAIAELKEGKVNEEIERILNNYIESECDRQLWFELQNRSDNFSKQFDRYVKQQSRMANTLKTINTGKGIDVETNLEVRTPSEVIKVKHFDSKIASMLETVRKKNYVIDVIDECLLVGVYSKKNVNLEMVFDKWAENLSIEFPITNYMSHFNAPTAFPLFINNFSDKDILSLLKGEITIKFTLDIEKWLKRLEDIGFPYRWLTEKQTARLSSKFKGYDPFKYKNRALEVGEGDGKVIIFDGIFGKMMYHFITPDSIISTFSMHKTMGENFEK